jgi:hypothetical protein
MMADGLNGVQTRTTLSKQEYLSQSSVNSQLKYNHHLKNKDNG